MSVNLIHNQMDVWKKDESSVIGMLFNNQENIMKEIVGCTKEGLMDMLWCKECEEIPESLGCLRKRRRLGNGYVED